MTVDRETTAELVKIATHMEHTQSALVDLRQEMKEARREGTERMAAVHGRMDDLKTEVTAGLTQLSADHQNLKEELQEHAEGDRRAFSLLWKVILGGGFAGLGGTGLSQFLGG